METTQDLIDYMIQRWGESQSADRARCLKWLQAAEQELWCAGPWHWREESIDYPLTIAQHTYACPAETANVLDLALATGEPLRNIYYRTFLRLYHQATAGTPTRWALVPQEPTEQLIRFRVWPIPTENTTLLMRRTLRAAVLTDEDTSFSRFPKDDRVTVANHALMLMALHEGKNDMATLYKGLSDRGLQAMMAQNEERTRGYR